MHYRFATPDDARALSKLNRQLIRDEGHRNAMNLAELTERMRGWLAGDYRAVLFELDSAIAGYALYRDDEEHIYLRQFYIVKAHRRGGVGRAAMDWLIANAWADAPRIRLDVLCTNTDGIAFWRAVGFDEYCLTMELEIT